MNARIPRCVTIALALCMAAGLCREAAAAITPAQRKELAAIRTDLMRVHTPVRHDAIDEAEKKTSDAEQRLENFLKDSGVSDKDSHITSIRKLIAARRQAIERAKEREAKKKGLSDGEHASKKGTSKEKGSDKSSGFVSQIAPIFTKHCLDCHGKEAKGGLRLDTFAGMEKGGKSGPLLVIGEADNSLLMARLTAAGDARMPKGGEPLSETECMKIAEWINKGAKFDGDDPNKPLTKLAAATDVPRPKSPVKIVVARPTGNETVSFVKDIAPFMVERCLRCHSGNDPKGGLSLESFESLLAGGKTGAEIVPGNLDKSRLWALVGNQKPFKMPPGDAYIKRAHWNHLRTWILEGAKYDGSDPKQPLRSLVPTETERRTAELAHTSPQELHERRRQRTAEIWRRALPKETPQTIDSDAFIVSGNVPTERLEQVARWAAAGEQAAQAFFDDRAAPVFKGGLAVFVMKDRFSYEEFCQVVERREPQAAIYGHAVVTPNLRDAYVVVQDRADVPADSPSGTQADLVEQIGAAFLMRSVPKLPDWLIRGSGRVLASANPTAAVPNSQWPQVYRLVGSLEKPEDLLRDGTFSPSAAREVGAAIVSTMVEGNGKPLFVRFVKGLAGGASQADALRDVYGTDLRGAATTFLTRAARSAGKSND
ncbi:MAG TPA: c-type cytochrome domain-containing protein [Planctomycetaceae bacterium]|nr:c-type cytochrome domain-containing protein [Planctomycetaceae bacterium]